MNPYIKPEDAAVKREPDADSPGALADDDIYEDTGDLAIPANPQGLWLARLPRFLLEQLLAEMNDVDAGEGAQDDLVQIGSLKVWGDVEDPRMKGVEARFQLDPSWKGAANVPAKYTMNLTNVKNNKEKENHNTYVFTEQNLAGYERGNRGTGRAGTAAQDSVNRVQKTTSQRPRRGRNIPKHTALVGAVDYEASLNPIENAEYRSFMKQKEASQKKEGSYFDQTTDIRIANQQSSVNAAKAFNNFGASAQKTQKPSDNRNARIAENLLMDMLLRIMEKDYKYWPLKKLKTLTKQPENYLKEVLGQIAILVKSGPFANHWTLREEHSSQKVVLSDNASEGEDEVIKADPDAVGT